MRYLKHLYRLKRLTLVILFLLLTLKVSHAQSPGDITADLGFRPAVNGFGFENYGEGHDNLTAVEVQRLFGDIACDSSPKGGDNGCGLTPTAQMWMESTNQDMSGGHCEGMAALSLLFYTRAENTSAFGGGNTNTLDLEGNDALQREIAFWWATQMTDPTDTSVINGTPSEIVNKLVDSINSKGDTYTVGIYMRDGSGGHAITPYAVTDQGGGINWIMVYDNNWPGDERHIEVDTKAETWQYNAATNPNEPESLYEGDAETNTLSLTPTSPRLQAQNCPFCGNVDYGSTKGYTGVSINAKGAHLTVTDDKGNVTGYSDGKWINTIPGAKVVIPKNIFIRGVLPPQIMVPNGSPFKITATEGPNTPPNDKATFTVVRNGAITKVGGVDLSSNPDSLNVDGPAIQYTSGDGGQTPTIEQGVTSAGDDYRYVVESNSAMSDNGTLDFSVDPQNGAFKVGGSDANQYSVNVDRIDEQGNDTHFFTNNLDVGAGDTADLNAGTWKDGDQITGDITGADGSEVASIDLQDEPQPTDQSSIDQSTNTQPTEASTDTGASNQGTPADNSSGG